MAGLFKTVLKHTVAAHSETLKAIVTRSAYVAAFKDLGMAAPAAYRAAGRLATYVYKHPKESAVATLVTTGNVAGTAFTFGLLATVITIPVRGCSPINIEAVNGQDMKSKEFMTPLFNASGKLIGKIFSGASSTSINSFTKKSLESVQQKPLVRVLVP
jgi:hypothetical protein